MRLWFKEALLPGGWAKGVRVAVVDGLIARVETGVPAADSDERHGAALPGLANVHSHAFQRGMAGLTETRGPARDSFWTWRQLMYRFLDRLSPDDIEAITAQAYVEMLQTGFTRVGEFHYLHHDVDGSPYANLAETAERVVAAARDTGIGLTLLPVFYAHATFGGAPPAQGQRRFINDLDSFARLVEGSLRAAAHLPGTNVGLAPHSLRAVTPEELSAVLAMLPDVPVHIHAAEQIGEVDGCLAWSGARPVEWLLDNAAVDGRWCLIHATHLDGTEVRRLAASGAVAGLCPVTECNLGDGIFPAMPYLERGGRFAVGSDSNVMIDPAAELRTIEYAQRLSLRARNVLAMAEGQSTGAALYVRAVEGGTRALGQPAHGLAEGAPADIVALDTGHVSLAGRDGDRLLDSWIFAGQSGMVASVWSGGRKVVTQGRHVAADAIAARYTAVLTRLLSR